MNDHTHDLETLPDGTKACIACGFVQRPVIRAKEKHAIGVDSLDEMLAPCDIKCMDTKRTTNLDLIDNNGCSECGAAKGEPCKTKTGKDWMSKSRGRATYRVHTSRKGSDLLNELAALRNYCNR